MLISYSNISQLLSQLSLENYAKTRNYANGAVTRLSPYISRGVLSTKQVLDSIKPRYPFQRVEKFVMELMWREYWQLIFEEKGEGINVSLKYEQVENRHGLCRAVFDAKTGVEAIDKGIIQLYKEGYLHNHMRMYIASIACNLARCHWLIPAKWMHYHLLDGDWASNALSWQWVSGASRAKKYYANQQNINHFFYSEQQHSFLDRELHELSDIDIPSPLQPCFSPNLQTPLPSPPPLSIDPLLPTCLYTSYNLDPFWKKGQQVNRVLLLEPSHFKAYPISELSINFILDLAKNIEKLQVFVGEFSQLWPQIHKQAIYFKSHPFYRHLKGIEEPREKVHSQKGLFPSFFAFWKQVKRELIW